MSESISRGRLGCDRQRAVSSLSDGNWVNWLHRRDHCCHALVYTAAYPAYTTNYINSIGINFGGTGMRGTCFMIILCGCFLMSFCVVVSLCCFLWSFLMVKFPLYITWRVSTSKYPQHLTSVLLSMTEIERKWNDDFTLTMHQFTLSTLDHLAELTGQFHGHQLWMGGEMRGACSRHVYPPEISVCF